MGFATAYPLEISIWWGWRQPIRLDNEKLLHFVPLAIYFCRLLFFNLVVQVEFPFCRSLVAGSVVGHSQAVVSFS